MRTFNRCRMYPSFIKSMLNSPILPFATISKRRLELPELIKEKIFIRILPILVFPAAFAPISTIAFLYLKLGLPAKYSPSIVELIIFLGYEKFILNSGNPRIFFNSRFIITIATASLGNDYGIIISELLPCVNLTSWKPAVTARQPCTRCTERCHRRRRPKPRSDRGPEGRTRSHL